MFLKQLVLKTFWSSCFAKQKAGTLFHVGWKCLGFFDLIGIPLQFVQELFKTIKKVPYFFGSGYVGPFMVLISEAEIIDNLYLPVVNEGQEDEWCHGDRMHPYSRVELCICLFLFQKFFGDGNPMSLNMKRHKKVLPGNERIPF